MGKQLTQGQIEDYHRNGYGFPFRAFGPDKAATCLKAFDDVVARQGDDVWAQTKIKPHLLFLWLNGLIREPVILDAVEDVLGPDILAWVVGVFPKKPHSPDFLNWHQDATYWGLSELAVATAWVALTPSRPENGCMRVVPGSHLSEQLPHHDTFAANSLLSRGQEVSVDVDEADAVDIVLQPGEFSLHHTMTIHGSQANRSATRRVGIAIRYVAAHVRQTLGDADSATLVRGNNTHGGFVLEPTPRSDFDPEVVPFYDRMVGTFKARKQSVAEDQDRVSRPAGHTNS